MVEEYRGKIRAAEIVKKSEMRRGLFLRGSGLFSEAAGGKF